MVNNGSISYDHDRDGTHTMLGGCEVKFRNMQHETWIAIRYENDKLTVSHDLKNKRAWPPVLVSRESNFQPDTSLDCLPLLEILVMLKMFLALKLMSWILLPGCLKRKDQIFCQKLILL